MVRHGVRSALAAAVAVALLAPVAGCSTAAPSTDDASAATDLSVVAEVYRTRSDPARGGLQLSVRNEGSAPLTIVRAVLESPALSAPVERDRTTEIGVGLTRDLALLLPAAACPATSTAPPEAVLSVLLADGRTTELRVPTTDRLGQWAAWLDAECFAAAVADRATITVRHEPERDGGALIGLRLEVESREAGVELLSLSDTVLFGIVSASDGARLTSVPLPTALDGERSNSIPVLLTPARCDAHALADDKQGTLFRVDVQLDGEPGAVTIAADGATRASLYDAYTRACGL